MGSSSCVGGFAFSWRIIPKAFSIKALWESWNYQFKRKLLWKRRDDKIIGDKIARQRRGHVGVGSRIQKNVVVFASQLRQRLMQHGIAIEEQIIGREDGVKFL